MLVVAAAACGAAPGPTDGGGAMRDVGRVTDGQHVRAITPSGSILTLEVAASGAKRAQGLMFRDEVPPGTGMFFRFERSAPHSFWMKNCRVPLDIAWLDEDLTVVHLAEDVPPCRDEPCQSYAPSANARYVIEVAARSARGLGLVPGARVHVAGVEGGA